MIDDSRANTKNLEVCEVHNEGHGLEALKKLKEIGPLEVGTCPR
jgi:hypothetical protein